MTDHSIFTAQQLAEFDRRGILRVPGLLSADRVGRARAYVQSRLALLGLWRDGAWRLDERPRPQWPDRGLQVSRAIGARRPDIEALIDEPRLLEAVDALLEGHAFDREMFKRPQVLFSLPNADRWVAPTGWHMDSPRLASGRRPGVQLFTFLDTVEPCGGGTLAVAGSHRLLNEGRVILAKELRQLLRREEFFRALYSKARDSVHDRVRLLNDIGLVGGVELQVVEFTGAPGDAYLMDLGLLHAVAPNATARPRMMATHRFWRADIVPELAQAFGWP
jgi:hypothetical protein